MKKLLSILLLVSMLILSLSSCNLLKQDNDGARKPHYLPGNIVVTEEKNGEKEAAKNITISYNSQNLPSRIAAIDAESNVEYTLDLTYDKNGNCVEGVYTYSDGKTEVTRYTYDEMGKLIKASYTYNNVDSGELTCIYDDNGNLIREVSTDSYTDGYSHVWEHTYDDNGNRIKYLYKHSNSDEVIYYHTYSYDDNGNLSEEIYYSEENGSLIFKYALSYTYDENGRLIKEVQTRDSDTGSERYAYYTIDYTYNENGAITKYVFTYYDGDKIIYEYNDYSRVYIASAFSSEEFLKYLREII